MTTKIDERRLADGAAAKALPEPTTRAEIEAQIERIGDAIAAMQSLDDLGSVGANNAADRDMQALIARRQALLDRLKGGGR